MNRRWSCRLGIRLEGQPSCSDPTKSITLIKEICKDTLAERDGRLLTGDRVLMVSVLRGGDKFVRANCAPESNHRSNWINLFSLFCAAFLDFFQINDEIVDGKPTQEIIEMMRIIRGPLCITVARKIDS